MKKTMTHEELLAAMVLLRACDHAYVWVEATPGAPADLWQSCTRGDWLIWLAVQAGVERRLVIEAVCDIAEEAQVYATGDTVLAGVWCIDATRRYVRGETDIEEVHAARTAVADAVADAAYAAAVAAAVAAATTVVAATTTVVAAATTTVVAATDAADADAAYAAAVAANARAQSLARSAALVRARIPWALVERALAAARRWADKQKRIACRPRNYRGAMASASR